MDLIAQAFHDSCVAPDDRPIGEWAADYIDLPAGGYAIPGLFHIQKSRQLIEPLLALKDHQIRIVSAAAAIQGGKSMLSDLWLPNILDTRPGPALLTMQTDKIAADHAEVRLLPVIRACKPLQRLIPTDRHKTRSTEIIFKNGVPLYIRGPALGNAQSKSIRYISIDEAWLLALKYPGRIREFMARASKYDELGTSKILVTSQGGDLQRDPEGKIIGDDWAKLWHEGDQSWWTVHCLNCQHRFIPRWTIDTKGQGKKEDLAGMKWDDNGGQIRYECPACRQAMIDTDATKAAWNAHGSYTITNPAAITHRSFTWPAWISGRWQPLVEEYLSAMQAKRSGILGPLKMFIQKKCGEFWEEQKQIEAPEAVIITADFQIKKSWPDEAYRFMSVDCQADLVLFYVVIRAWAKNGESRRLFRGQMRTWEAVRAIQEEFQVPSKFVGVDSGYEATKVYRQCCRHIEANGRGWCAFAETDQDWFTHHFKDRTEKRIYSEKQNGNPILGMKNEDSHKWLESVSPHAAKLYQQGQLNCPIYLWSRPAVSDILAGLRDGKSALWTSPVSDASDAEERLYRQHMAGEVKKMKPHRRTGVPTLQWVVIGPNHYWSCEKIQVVQASLAGCLSLEILNAKG